MIYRRVEGAYEDHVLLIHGLGEHSGRYWGFIEKAIMEKISVYAFDLPGHGKSSGIRGHAPLKKTLKIVDEIARSLPKPPVIFGHSLGGLIAARYVENGGRASMLILSSPAFSYDKEEVTPGLVKLAKFLAAIVPFLPMDNRIDPEKLSRNKETVEKYVRDPLVHRKISVALARDFFLESEIAIKEAEKIEVPTLLLIGGADKVTPPEGAKRFFENLRVKDKELIEYPGAYHEIFEDPEYSSKLYENIFRFIKSYLRR